MSSIFLSYASADRARVEPFVKSLEAHGFDVWWDRDISYGESYHRVIEQALERATCVIVVWSSGSVGSEWVTNEASEARKRGILVPVLLDDVEPPLEFRHLQSARLLDVTGSTDDAQLQQLIGAVRRVAERGAAPAPVPAIRSASVRLGKSWWETPAGWAVGGAALLVATSLFLLALRAAGVIGASAPVSPGSVTSGSPVEPAQRPADPGRGAAQDGSSTPAAAAGGAAGATSPSTGTIDLLNVRDGAQIVAANQASWKDYIYGGTEPRCSLFSAQAFVTFAFRDERPARFNRLGVFVESTGQYNLKTVELDASDDSERGPFRKIGTFVVPNYRNERQPFHEFVFEPVTARYVKLVAVDSYDSSRPNDITVCTMELLGTVQ